MHEDVKVEWMNQISAFCKYLINMEDLNSLTSKMNKNPRIEGDGGHPKRDNAVWWYFHESMGLGPTD